MRAAASLLLLLFAFGCASTARVPLPTVTPFDDNPKARSAYLAAYQEYYRAAVSGNYSKPGCSFGQDGTVSTAREIGGWHGMLAGHKVWSKQEDERIMQMERADNESMRDCR